MPALPGVDTGRRGLSAPRSPGCHIRVMYMRVGPCPRPAWAQPRQRGRTGRPRQSPAQARSATAHAGAASARCARRSSFHTQRRRRPPLKTPRALSDEAPRDRAPHAPDRPAPAHRQAPATGKGRASPRTPPQGPRDSSDTRRRTAPPAAPGACADTTLQPNRSNLDRIRAAVLCLVNRERAAHGEVALPPDAHLVQAAQAHTESMAFGDYFEHVGPGGDTPAQPHARHRLHLQLADRLRSRREHRLGHPLAGHAPRDRRSLDGLARTPRQHPRRPLPRHRHRRLATPAVLAGPRSGRRASTRRTSASSSRAELTRRRPPIHAGRI